MSIRKEHLDVFDKSLSSLQENVDLAKQLVLDKGSIEKKIETGFNLIGGLGQSYQGIQNVKAMLRKGTNAVKSTTKALQGGQEQARTTDTGSQETPTSQPDENVARASTAENTEAPTLPEETTTISETSFMSPEAEATARATQAVDPGVEAFRDRIAPDLFERLQQTGLTPEGNIPPEIFQEQASRAFGELPEGGITMTEAGATPELDAIPEGERGLRMLESAGAIRQQATRRATQALTSTAEEATETPGLLDQLAPLRELMARRTQPINASEAQQRMMDFDPEANVSQVGNLSTEGSTRVLSGVENTIDEAGNALQSGVEGVTNTISDIAGSVSRAGAGLAENLTSVGTRLATRAGAGLAENLTSVGTRLATTAGQSLAPEVSDALGAVAAGSLDLPIAGEVVALLAGVGSAIASAFEPQAPKPTISQVGADFSNTDEHGGASLSAY
jgi:hypothetical protein